MTSYYQCVSCTKTSAQEDCVIKTDGNLICPHCLDTVEFAFGVDTLGEPEPSIGFCDGCDELESKLHLMDGDWLCDTCKATVIAVQEDKAKAAEIKTTIEAIEGLRISCTDHWWEMLKAHGVNTMPKIHWFTVWLIFASLALFLASLAFVGGAIHFAWGYYVS